MFWLAVMKVTSVVQRGRSRRKALESVEQAQHESHHDLQRLSSQRAEMNAVYAAKVARKRAQQGLDEGAFAIRAIADLAAVTQFMTAHGSATTHKLRDSCQDDHDTTTANIAKG